MATTNVSLGTTELNYVIDYSELTFTEEGKNSTATVNITLPNSETFKNQYINRSVPNVLITTKGTLTELQGVTVNISAVSCNVGFSEQATANLSSLSPNFCVLLLVQQGDTGWFVFNGLVPTPKLGVIR